MNECSHAAQNELVVLKLSLLAIITIIAVPLVIWGWDVHNDRKHVVTVISTTPVFGGDAWCHDGQRLVDVPPGIHLEVRRIGYWKDCATLDVALSDGRQNTLFREKAFL